MSVYLSLAPNSKFTQLVRENLQFLKQNLLIHALLETLWFKYFPEIQYSRANINFY